jgi:hypothetical protein
MLDSRNSKRKVKKSKLALPQIKLVKNMILGNFFWRFIRKLHLIWTYGSILTVQKSLIIN